MKHNNLIFIAMIISSLLLIATISVQAADISITDSIEDVNSMDYLTQELTVVTSNPFITVDNIDIVKATYTQQGSSGTVSVQVKGNIENRGKIMDSFNESSFNNLDFVEYDFQLSTSENEYSISYANLSGQYSNGVDTTNLTSSDFSVSGDTLTITFLLTSATEVYENLSVTSMFVRMNWSPTDIEINGSGFVYLTDIAPNPPLEIMEVIAPNIGAVGDTIQFNSSISPMTGQPPYSYHWDFGDQGTSTQLNPTHVYTKAGDYTYTFVVTDQAGITASETGSITISSENGGSNGSTNNNMLIFLAILAVIIIVGVVIIVWIIRR